MKKLLTLVLAALLCLSFAACGTKDSGNTDAPADTTAADTTAADTTAADTTAADTTAADTAEETQEAATDSFTAVEGTVGGHTIKILGAEAFEDSEGGDAIRIFYDYTNNSDEIISAWSAFTISCVQDGKVLDYAYTTYGEESEYDRYDNLGIRPGVTVRCISEYEFDKAGGTVTYNVEDFWEEGAVSCEFDPANLPGENAEPFTVTEIKDPQWIAEGTPTAGTVGDTEIELLDYDFTVDYSGNKLIRVYFNFTNNGDSEFSPWIANDVSVLQDGIELEMGYAEDENEADKAGDTAAPLGQKIKCALCYKIRGYSNVEFVISDSWSGDLVATEFEME